MKNSKTLEAFVGGFVVLGIVALVFLAYKVSSVNNVGKDGTYTVYANFNSVSGLKAGASVTIAGVKVGQIESIEIDTEEYEAKVAIATDNRYNNLPLDSSISVLTQGLLGEKYLGIDVGGDVEFLQNGDEFDFTKSAVVLERLIDKFFLKASSAPSK